MKLSSIPDTELWEGAERLTLGAPPGAEDTIRPLEVCATLTQWGPEFAFRIEFSQEDIEKILKHRAIYVTQLGESFSPVRAFHVHEFSLVTDEEGL